MTTKQKNLSKMITKNKDYRFNPNSLDAQLATSLARLRHSDKELEKLRKQVEEVESRVYDLERWKVVHTGKLQGVGLFILGAIALSAVLWGGIK